METSVCLHIKKLTNNQTKSQRKTIHKKQEKATTRMLWLLWKPYPQLGCVSQDSDALVSQRGKQSRRNPKQKVLEPVRRIKFTKSTVRQAIIREKNGPSLGHQRSLYAMKMWGSVPRRDWTTAAMCPWARLGIFARKYTSSKKIRQKLHSTRPRKNGYNPGSINKKSWRRVSFW